MDDYFFLLFFLKVPTLEHGIGRRECSFLPRCNRTVRFCIHQVLFPWMFGARRPRGNVQGLFNRNVEMNLLRRLFQQTQRHTTILLPASPITPSWLGRTSTRRHHFLSIASFCSFFAIHVFGLGHMVGPEDARSLLHPLRDRGCFGLRRWQLSGARISLTPKVLGRSGWRFCWRRRDGRRRRRCHPTATRWFPLGWRRSHDGSFRWSRWSGHNRSHFLLFFFHLFLFFLFRATSRTGTGRLRRRTTASRRLGCSRLFPRGIRRVGCNTGTICKGVPEFHFARLGFGSTGRSATKLLANAADGLLFRRLNYSKRRRRTRLYWSRSSFFLYCCWFRNSSGTTSALVVLAKAPAGRSGNGVDRRRCGGILDSIFFLGPGHHVACLVGLFPRSHRCLVLWLTSLTLVITIDCLLFLFKLF